MILFNYRFMLIAYCVQCMAPTFIGDFALRGAELRQKGLNRIGNLLVPNAVRVIIISHYLFLIVIIILYLCCECIFAVEFCSHW
jgi:hypothetical protein